MSYTLNFTTVEGENNPGDITVYALSTCGFCKRALQFLRDHSITFRYVYVDLLPFEVKQELKNDLKEKAGRNVGFPFAIINDNKYLIGFKENEWREELKVA